MNVMKANMTGKVMTVKGLLDPGNLGITLMHEHLFMGGVFEFQPFLDINTSATASDNWSEKLALGNMNLARQQEGAIEDAMFLDDEAIVVSEVSEFRDWGGSTIVDVTSIGIARDPRALLRVSNATNLNIIMGCSWYVETSHPDNINTRTIEDLADEIIRDITVGVGDTNIRSGIIGEVGIRGNPLSLNEIKITRASAWASLTTGAAISLHGGGHGKEKLEIANIIKDEGGDLSRIIFGHSDAIAGNLSLMLDILETGAYIEFDLLGRSAVHLAMTRPISDNSFEMPLDYLSYSSTALVAYVIPNLIKAGFVDKILLSQDVWTKIQLKHYGGTGYSFILETFLPHLRRLGVSEDDINKIVVENPKRILTF
jgi:phosphotriesterase-related protein